MTNYPCSNCASVEEPMLRKDGGETRLDCMYCDYTTGWVYPPIGSTDSSPWDKWNEDFLEAREAVSKYYVRDVQDDMLSLVNLPSVWKGEVPALSFSSIGLNGENIVTGNLWCKEGVWTFDGDVDESAKIFFDGVKHLLETKPG